MSKEYLNHSAAGTHWKKKNAKYIRKEGDRYIYADGTSTSAPVQPQVQQRIAVPKNLQKTQGVSRTVMKSTPKNYEENLAKSSAPKYNQGISKYATSADRHTDGETKEVTAADRTSAKQKAAARASSGGGGSTAIRRKDEIDLARHEDKSKGNPGHQSYDPNERRYTGSNSSGSKVAGAGNFTGGNSKPASLKDMLKALSVQNAISSMPYNSQNIPQPTNLMQESLGRLAAYGSNSRALKSGFDAVNQIFSKKKV